MLEAVPAAPAAAALPPLSVSVEVWEVSGTPFLAYTSDSWVAWLALTLALTITCALLGPSVCASIASTSLDIVVSYFWAADSSDSRRLELPAADGHSSEPSAPVIVTLFSDRPGTL